jgi:hypothetical protein
MIDQCYFCSRTLAKTKTETNTHERYECDCCGVVELERSLAYYIATLAPESKRKLAYYFRKHKIYKTIPTPLSRINLSSFLLSIKLPISVNDKINELLLFLDKSTTYAGEEITINYKLDLNAVYATNANELSFLLKSLVEFNMITISKSTVDEASVVVLFEGWKKIDQLKSTIIPSNRVFVAMDFSEKMNSLYDNSISIGINNSGYVPFRVDRKEHNNDIVDEIIVAIRQSKFMVADFTNGRNGVYFEAGYAMGIGIPVIWTCSKEQVEKLHFDTRQYNHITWIDENDLKIKLENRIKATII